MDMSETYEVTLTTLTYGGDAMGRLEDGRAVFVPFGLPGERVRVRLTEEKRGFARARSSKFYKLHRKESHRAANISVNAADVIISICRMKCN